MSASFIPPSERDSSLISRMRAWVCLYAAARPRETKALSYCCSSVVSLIRYFLVDIMVPPRFNVTIEPPRGTMTIMVFISMMLDH